MLFAVICTDRKDGLETRKLNRARHLEYLDSIGDALKGAGPFLDEDGNPYGSMVIVDMPNLDAVQKFAYNDPYSIAGLFDNVDIRHWNWFLNNPYNTET